MTMIEKVIILDLGSPYSQDLTRTIRTLGVYSELHPYKLSATKLKEMNPSGIILFGDDYKDLESRLKDFDKDVLNLRIPILAINAGMQLLINEAGGTIADQGKNNLEQAVIHVQPDAGLLADTPKEQSVLLRGEHALTTAPDSYQVNATDQEGNIVAISNDTAKKYGLMFHPEADETEHGETILTNFLRDVCGCACTWSMETFKEVQMKEIRETVGNENVLLALSGGVDSSVVAALLHEAIGDQLTCIFVDHGLLRKNEADEVMKVFAEDFNINMIKVDAQERFLNKLKGVTDPEEKRKIIGNEFINVFDDEAEKLTDMTFLAQGTLYSDVIESGVGDGKVVKSHHNVGGLPEHMDFKLIEPISKLFKDEVRELGTLLGIPDYIVWRQPFPGPGLGIRVLGEVTVEKLHIVREADAILREEIAATGLDRDIWQYFAVLPNIRSVGVTDASRTYDHTVGIRAVHSVDGMTSEWARIPWDVLEKISSRIVREVKHVNRVVYDITSKPPSTIEWE